MWDIYREREKVREIKILRKLKESKNDKKCFTSVSSTITGVDIPITNLDFKIIRYKFKQNSYLLLLV